MWVARKPPTYGQKWCQWIHSTTTTHASVDLCDLIKFNLLLFRIGEMLCGDSPYGD